MLFVAMEERQRGAGECRVGSYTTGKDVWMRMWTNAWSRWPMWKQMWCLWVSKTMKSRGVRGEQQMQMKTEMEKTMENAKQSCGMKREKTWNRSGGEEGLRGEAA